MSTWNLMQMMNAYDQGRFEDMVDPYMPSGYNAKAMELLVTLAISCCSNDQESRPNMSTVVRVLEDIARMIEPWSMSMQRQPSQSRHRVNVDDARTSSNMFSVPSIATSTSGAGSTSDPRSFERGLDNSNIFATHSSLILQGGRWWWSIDFMYTCSWVV